MGKSPGRLRLIIILGLFALGFFLPLGYFITRGAEALGAKGAGALAGVAGILLRTLKFTFLQAFLSATLAVLLAMPGAFSISHYRFRFQRFLHSLSLIPFVLPSIVVIICMISFYGKSGFLNRIFGFDANLVYSVAGILIAHVFFNFSLALRIIGDGWGRIDSRYREVAESLGDTRFRSFFRITLPLLVPYIVSAFTLIFIYCFMSFGIVLVFGGIRYATLEVRIYQELFQKLDYARTAVYAIAQLALSSVFLFLSTRIAGKRQSFQRPSGGIRLVPASVMGRLPRLLFAGYWLFICVFLFGPIITMILRSLKGSAGIGAAAYRSLFDDGYAGRSVQGLIRSSVPMVILRSVFIAALSGSLTFITAFSAAIALKRRRAPLWRGLFQLPMGISMISLAIGLRLVFGGYIPPILLVVIGQFFVCFPFVFRITDTVVGDLPDSLIDCAVSLGARGFALIRTVHFPVLRKGLINALAFSAAIAFADFTVVLGVGRGKVVTFPVAIYRLIGFRSFDLALALSTIYILFCLLLFIIVDRTNEDRALYKRVFRRRRAA